MKIKKLGQDSFGVVYRPYPIECKDTKSLPPPKDLYIGKFSNPSSMRPSRYLQIQKRRAIIDPESHFTSRLYAICPKEKSEDPTSFYWNNDKGNYHTLEFVYQYVGVSYDHFSWTHIQKNPFCVQHLFKSFSYILKGLQFMIHHRIVHGDIKPANLTYDIYKNRSYLIDYDYLMPDTELMGSFRKNLKSIRYVVWPPEINFALLENDLSNIDGCILNPPTKEFPLSIPSQQHRLKQFLKSEVFFQKILPHKDQLEYWKKMDIYALGLAWTLIFGKSNPDIWKLILKMIELDFFKRIDIDQLLIEFHHIISSFPKPAKTIESSPKRILILCSNNQSYREKPLQFPSNIFGQDPRFIYVGLDLIPNIYKHKFKRNLKLEALDFLKDHSLDFIISEACPILSPISILSTFSLNQFNKKLKKGGELWLQRPTIIGNQQKYTVDGIETEAKPLLHEFRWIREAMILKASRTVAYNVYKPMFR